MLFPESERSPIIRRANEIARSWGLNIDHPRGIDEVDIIIYTRELAETEMFSLGIFWTACALVVPSLLATVNNLEVGWVPLHHVYSSQWRLK